MMAYKDILNAQQPKVILTFYGLLLRRQSIDADLPKEAALKLGVVALLRVAKYLKRVELENFLAIWTQKAENKGFLASKKVAKFLEGLKIFKSNCESCPQKLDLR